MEQRLRLDIVSDAICPWCYIGKRHLECALELLGAAGQSGSSIVWHPFQLNPDMPRAGAERAAYRAAKFGGAERAAALDARVTEAASAVGLHFRLDRITRTPNTLAAHRLIRYAGRLGAQDAVVEALFRAYFTDGRDIGDPDELADAAAGCGLDRTATVAFLAGGEDEAEVLAEDGAARRGGINGVPTFFIDGRLLCSGALPAEHLAAGISRLRRQEQPAGALEPLHPGA
jgi:predicted DsbA family dithiol-disulfide isomerase